MRAVIQRVREASVVVEGREVSRIGHGLLVLLGVATTDSDGDADRLAEKVATLRIFDDASGRMNLDVSAVGGAILCVSQFTLLGDVRRGNRPSWDAAAPGPAAQPLYERFCDRLASLGIDCRRGVFGAEMSVRLDNDGPVTLVIETATFEQPRRA